MTVTLRVHRARKTRSLRYTGRMGRHRWVVEHLMSWPNGCRRLNRRYEHKAERFLACVGIVGMLICYRRCGTGALKLVG
ncbi:hypothetical protein GCM10010503_39520 [Streptomyces lucensis JCM 4490]|uniref:Transposase n=1 Tax=Streptomyces lucensis JCM 4490 TaxID=1306176 RepID=A0A918MRF5_9ACTN|nr:transposase [Streptomyces lucensis]GGW58541.1 hypothetical protein GCM10010503_39520 [Streptomyces lucensis JCM 4490]